MKFFVVSVLFFLCVNHFDGFIQDAIPYTLQAVEWLHPGRFIGDPGFMFGNQGALSIFSPIYVVFLSLFGVDNGALAFTFLTHVFVAIAIFVLAVVWCRRFHLHRMMMLMVLVYYALYAHNETRAVLWHSIKAVEAFPVARMFALIFGFWGVACLLKNKRIVSLILFIIGFVVHPLTVGWAIPLWMFFYFPKTRRPIFFVSLLFPLTVIINRGLFSSFPSDWYVTSWDIPGIKVVALTLFEYCVFFALASRIYISKTFSLYVQSLLLVVVIATYWFVASVFTSHIFLYQSQTFRVAWICQISAVFTFVLILYHLYNGKLRKKRLLSFCEKMFLLMGVILWIDSPFILTLAILGFILLFGRSKNQIKWVRIALLSIFMLLVIFVSYEEWIIFPQKILEFWVNSAFFVQYSLAIFSGLSIFLKMIYPRLRIVFDVILAIFIVLSFYGSTLFVSLNFSLAFLLMAFLLPFRKGYSLSIFAILMLVLVTWGYDRRNNEKKEKDSIMNQFWAAPPFPNVPEWGRVLFATERYGGKLPRIAFLTGAYYDVQYDVSSIFFRGQEKEAIHRMTELYCGCDDCSKEKKTQPRELIESRIFEILADKDSLEQRTNFLCSRNEISYLVADKGYLNLNLVDSLFLNQIDYKIFLYSCN